MDNLLIIKKYTLQGIADAVKEKRGLESVAVIDLAEEIAAIQGDTFKFLVTADYPKAELEKIEAGEHIPEMVMSLYLDEESEEL